MPLGHTWPYWAILGHIGPYLAVRDEVQAVQVEMLSAKTHQDPFLALSCYPLVI